MPLKLVGKNVVKPDALDKVTGKALYVGDLKRENMLYAKAVRSPHAHARVLSVDVRAALSVPGVESVVTAQDIPGTNFVGMTGNKDQQVLANKKVRFYGEAVAVVAARTLAAAKEGVRKVKVDYEVLPVVETPEQGLRDDAPLVSEKGNLCWHKKIVHGDWEEAVRKAAAVVSGEYRTQTVEHLYLEPEAVLAEQDENGLLVWSTTKSVHLDKKEIARVLDLPGEKVQVVAPYIGGSFGGKSDLALNCMAALLCLKTGYPVSMIQDREESMQVSTKRHPCTIRYTHAADAEGNLTAIKLDLVADAGAYIDYTPPTMQRMIVHGAGPYRVPNVWLEARGVLTNNPISGAMRGFGVPQVVFACERQMDRLGKKLGLDPVNIRLKNVLRKGDLLVTGETLQHETGLQEGLLKAREMIKIQDSNFEPQDDAPQKKAAWGVACYHYGNGRTGMPNPGVATVSLQENGGLQMAVGSPDIGQGSDTILKQIAAEALGVEIQHVTFISADTRCTLDSGTTSGTRLTALVGKAVQTAAENLHKKLLETAAGLLSVPVANLKIDSDEQGAWVTGPGVTLGFNEIYQRALSKKIEMEVTAWYYPSTTTLSDENVQGKPYGAYTYGVQLAKLGVNEYTGGVDLEKLISLVNVGQVVNPVLLEGQVEGGTMMGIGYALLEEIKLKGGRILNPNFSSYLIPTSCDAVRIECHPLSLSDQEGPYGAVGIGEPSLIPVPAAIANAVSHVTGVEYYNLPLSLEEVLTGLKEK